MRSNMEVASFMTRAGAGYIRSGRVTAQDLAGMLFHRHAQTDRRLKGGTGSGPAYLPLLPCRLRSAAFCACSMASTRSDAARASACAASMLGKYSGMR